MPNFPNIPFADGDPFTPEKAYEAFYCPVFDGQTQYLGHRPPLADHELDPNGIRGQVNLLTNGLRCSQGSGLVVNYTSGQVVLPNGTLVNKPSGAVLVPDNATSFVFVNSLGDIVASTSRTVNRCTLAQVVTVGGTITSLIDHRFPSVLQVRPPSYVLRSFGGQSNTPKVCVQNEVLAGVIECSTFSIPAGVSVTVNRFCKIVASATVDIRGTVTVTQQAQGAPEAWFYMVSGAANTGYLPGVGLGNRGEAYHYTQQRFGSGGGIGYTGARPGLTSTSAMLLRKGGDGGGAFIVEAAGNITVFTSATITARGQDGSTPDNFDGATTFQGMASGSGGGSGGLVELVSAGTVTIQTGATIDVRGANGSPGFIHMPGYAGRVYTAGGRGGSGGVLVTIGAEGVNTTGFTFLNAGGSWGAFAQVNGALISQSSTQVLYATGINGGLYLGGIGGGFAGGQATRTVTTTNYADDTDNLSPASSGLHIISTTLPSG